MGSIFSMYESFAINSAVDKNNKTKKNLKESKHVSILNIDLEIGLHHKKD